jgi:hypothetical protein
VPKRISSRRRAWRRDDRGHRWTDAGVERAVIRLVRRLSPGWARRKITRRTRLHTDLGWDDWYALRVARLVRATLHETVEDRVLLGLKSVGDLVALVWSGMDPL